VTRDPDLVGGSRLHQSLRCSEAAVRVEFGMTDELDPAPSPGATAIWQSIARIAFAVALVGVGVWILSEFVAALAWAVVLAIALWPFYRRLLGVLPAGAERALGPGLATLAVAIAFITPLVLLGIALAHESHFIIQFFGQARHEGIPVPEWVGTLPYFGPTATQWWQDNLSDPAGAEELIGRVNLRSLSESARHYGAVIVHRLAILGFTLLTLFFLFRDGDMLAERLRDLSDRVIGLRGERIARDMIAAVHGTVNGLVLVGLGEGVLLGITYFFAGLPYPASIGALTGVAAVIPFAAPVVYSLAGIYLLAIGKTAGGIVILVIGSVVIFIADHFIRPVLIGGATRLPFLLVLLGLLGGLETFGFLGLFLGPAMMAALVALWRDWTEPPLTPEMVAVRARRGTELSAARRKARADRTRRR
jgi:predicted PurR-regulated permease PerM